MPCDPEFSHSSACTACDKRHNAFPTTTNLPDLPPSGAAGCSFCQRSQTVIQQVADPINTDIRWRVLCQNFGIVSVMALAGKDGGHLGAPDSFHRGQDAKFVIDEHVVRGREALFHILEFLFLMNVDQHVAVNCFPDAGALDLKRLKNHVTIREDHRLAPLLYVLYHIQRIGIKPRGKWIVDQEM